MIADGRAGRLGLPDRQYYRDNDDRSKRSCATSTGARDEHVQADGRRRREGCGRSEDRDGYRNHAGERFDGPRRPPQSGQHVSQDGGDAAGRAYAAYFLGRVSQGSECAGSERDEYRTAGFLQGGGLGVHFGAARRLENLSALASDSLRRRRRFRRNLWRRISISTGRRSPAQKEMLPRWRRCVESTDRAAGRGARAVLRAAEFPAGSESQGDRDGEEPDRRAARRSHDARLDEPGDARAGHQEAASDQSEDRLSRTNGAIIRRTKWIALPTWGTLLRGQDVRIRARPWRKSASRWTAPNGT